MTKTTDVDSSSMAAGSKSERRKVADTEQSLLPGLPDDVAQACLSLAQPSILYQVCSSWRRLIYSPSFPPFLSIYALLLSTTQTDHSKSIELSSFDPISSKWNPVPSPPVGPPYRLLLRHPSFSSSFTLPIQSVTVSGSLVLLAATTNHFLPALPHPLIFNPLTRSWKSGPPLSTPRRWCATGASGSSVYVASGIGSRYSPEVARSVERWELGVGVTVNKGRRNACFEKWWRWEKMGGLRDGKLSREAIEAVGWRGKLCMVNVKGRAAKEGMVYDVERDRWEEMPEGMLRGWTGPAASMEEEDMYVVDEWEGALKKYDGSRERWVEVFKSVSLRGARHMAAGGGRLCIVCDGGVQITVVDVLVTPPRFWPVHTPTGLEAVSLHILPRMCRRPFPSPI